MGEPTFLCPVTILTGSVLSSLVLFSIVGFPIGSIGNICFSSFLELGISSQSLYVISPWYNIDFILLNLAVIIVLIFNFVVSLIISVLISSSCDFISAFTSWISQKFSCNVWSWETQAIKCFNSSLDLLLFSSLASTESTKYWGILFNSSSLIFGTIYFLINLLNPSLLGSCFFCCGVNFYNKNSKLQQDYDTIFYLDTYYLLIGIIFLHHHLILYLKN